MNDSNLLSINCFLLRFLNVNVSAKLFDLLKPVVLNDFTPVEFNDWFALLRF